MHADTQQLIALRDAQPVDAAVQRHVTDCDECQRELESLQRTRARLKALPQVTPPPPSQHVLKATPAASRSWTRPAYLSMAASLVLAAALAVWLMPGDDVPTAPGTVSMPAPAAQPTVVPAVEPVVSETRRRLQVRSAELERQWRDLRRHAPAVRRVGFETGTARLKSRLLALDAEHLVSAGGADRRAASDYWNRRVQLLDSLVDIERAELLARGDGTYQVVRAAGPAERSYP